MEIDTLPLYTLKDNIDISKYFELLNSIVQLNSEKVISLKGEEKEKIRLLKMKGYLNPNNFRLQIGKMQEDGNTIYSPETIGLFVDYILNHAELDENGNGKVIIQLWPDLAQCLSQNGDNGILSFSEEKKKIEELIKEKLKEKGSNIEIEIQSVADNYPEIFEAIKDGKNGIIPQKEPKLENIELPLKSPQPIIEYLAYNFHKDSNLGGLFYSTKPAKYKEQDGENYILGTSDADYYSVVEVGIRLYEILNGIYIQGGIDRQRVYDKIIYLILFGDDKISKQGEQLKLEDYPSLGKLHNWLKKSGKYDNTKMMQLYIDLDKVSSETKKAKSILESKLKNASVELVPELVGEISEKIEQLNRFLKKLRELENENRMLQESRHLSNKLQRIKNLVLVALLSFLGGVWIERVHERSTESSIIPIEDNIEVSSKKGFSNGKLSPQIIKNTIESELDDFSYIDYNRDANMPGILMLQGKVLEYKIGNITYYYIVVVYRDTPLLLAKKGFGGYEYSLRDGREVAEHMEKELGNNDKN